MRHRREVGCDADRRGGPYRGALECAARADFPLHFAAGGSADGRAGKSMLAFPPPTTFRRLLRRIVIVLKTAIMVGLLWIAGATMRTAMGEANGPGRGVLPIFLGRDLAPIVY